METPERKISRRYLLFKYAPRVAAAGVGAAFLAKEARFGANEESCIRTSVGEFYPVYGHYDEAQVGDLSPLKKIDIHFQEGALPAGEEGKYSLHQHSLEQLLEFVIPPNPDFFSALVQRDAELVFGDTYPFPDEHWQRLIAGIEFNVGLVLLSSLSFTRRQFLKESMIVTGTWGVSDFLAALGSYGADEIRKIKSNNFTAALARIANRLHGIQSHLHPERPIVLFRNAVFAHKMLTYSSQVEENLNRPPKATFNIGRNHAGIEDFFIAGPKVCEWVITNVYPRAFLEKVVEINGRLVDFCTSRAIRFHLRPGAAPLVVSDNIVNLTVEGVEDRKILDQELFKTLRERLE